MKNFFLEWFNALIIVGIVFFVRYQMPTVWNLIESISLGLTFFLILFLLCFTWTHITYMKSTGDYEEETEATKFVIQKNKIVWLAFWFFWSIYCSTITIINNSLTSHIITMTLFATLPGITAFIIARKHRMDDRIPNEEVKHNMQKYASRYNKEGAFNLFTDKMHYSGYIGLICIPIYTIATLVGLLITNMK